MKLTDKNLQDTNYVPLLKQLDVKSVVVFRALQLGDMLCAVPALRALRAALPHARITLVGLPWAEQFVSRFSNYLDDFVAFPGHPAFPEQPLQENSVPAFYNMMQARQYDLALQMHGNGETSLQVVSAFGAKTTAGYCPADVADPSEIVKPAPARSNRLLAYPDTGTEPERLLRLVEFLGAPSRGSDLEFPLTAQDEQELTESGLNAGLAAKRYICIHPGARFRDKCWPPQRFAEVADQLADEFGLSVVLTGSAKEADLTAAVSVHMRHEAIDAAAPISIGAMAALMSRARLLVCNDTGVSHIAAGLKLPSVVIFSKADIRRWAPLSQERHRCIWDPEGAQVSTAVEYARLLLRETGTALKDAGH